MGLLVLIYIWKIHKRLSSNGIYFYPPFSKNKDRNNIKLSKCIERCNTYFQLSVPSIFLVYGDTNHISQDSRQGLE